MTQCSCEKESNVVQFPRTRIQVDSDTAVVDQELLDRIKRRLQIPASQDGPREIEVFADDLLALESEKHFKSRFGFVLGRRGRIALFDVIDQYDLTSDEVKALNRVGAIAWDGQQLRIGTQKWVGYAGFFYLFLIALFWVPAAIAFVHAPNDALRSQAVLFAVLVTLTLWAGWIYNAFIRPFRIYARRTAVLGVMDVATGDDADSR